MGKKIDSFVLTIAAAVAFYLYFQRAFENRITSILLALLACILLRRFLSRIAAHIRHTSWLEKRRIRRSAGGSLMRLACMDADDALERVSALLSAGYGNDAPVELIQAHPSVNLSQDKLFEAWRAHRGKDRLVICTTCRCDSSCRLLASSMKKPQLALVDADTLGELITEHSKEMIAEEAAHKRSHFHFRRAGMLLVNRKNAPRCLLFSGSMLMMYVFSSNMYYLAASLMLLLVALLSFRRFARPAKLF